MLMKKSRSFWHIQGASILMETHKGGGVIVLGKINKKVCVHVGCIFKIEGTS